MKIPNRGFVFWPVGNGDSTTILVDSKTVIQVDVNHVSDSNNEDDPREPIIDRLVEFLPTVDKKPYLAAFALTHPDKDHCTGFSELLKQVTIGEIWFTPRVFSEYKKDLCEEAKAFQKEAKRRMKLAIEKQTSCKSGDRIRIIGFDDLLKSEPYKGFPSECLTVPGNTFSSIDGKDKSKHFSAFVHSPFKDDSDGERNDTSLGLQITLKNNNVDGKALLLGDLSFEPITRIFKVSKDSTLEWDVLLAPHHCSKKVMYIKDDNGNDVLQNDIVKSIGKAIGSPGYVVSSSHAVPGTNTKGDDPPHTKAKNRYTEISNKFLCTAEHPNEESPTPIVFSLTDKGLEYLVPKTKQTMTKSEGSLQDAVNKARGTNEPPSTRVGFGTE